MSLNFFKLKSFQERTLMKKNIHPESFEVTAHCTCGNQFVTSSTQEEVRTTLCSACHPFYTGQQKFVDTAGRIEKFQQRYNNAAKKKS